MFSGLSPIKERILRQDKIRNWKLIHLRGECRLLKLEESPQFLFTYFYFGVMISKTCHVLLHDNLGYRCALPCLNFILLFVCLFVLRQALAVNFYFYFYFILSQWSTGQSLPRFSKVHIEIQKSSMSFCPDSQYSENICRMACYSLGCG